MTGSFGLCECRNWASERERSTRPRCIGGETLGLLSVFVVDRLEVEQKKDVIPFSLEGEGEEEEEEAGGEASDLMSSDSDRPTAPRSS